MRKIIKSVVFGGALAFGDMLAANPAIQPQISFTEGAANTWNSDWVGVENRTYFYQWSFDLVTWHYAPFMEFGAGTKSWGIDASSGGQPIPKIFVRLKFVDATLVGTLQEAMDADFDGDGLPNWYEVNQVGSDPLNRLSAGEDSDGDGLGDGWEMWYLGSLSNTGASDYDGDGLSNLQEFQLGLAPGLYDSDGDGIADSEDPDPAVAAEQSVIVETVRVLTPLR